MENLLSVIDFDWVNRYLSKDACNYTTNVKSCDNCSILFITYWITQGR